VHTTDHSLITLHTLTRIIQTFTDRTPTLICLEPIDAIHATHRALAPHEGLLLLAFTSVLLPIIIIGFIIFPPQIL
jgi:hypothetical protein